MSKRFGVDSIALRLENTMSSLEKNEVVWFRVEGGSYRVFVDSSLEGHDESRLAFERENVIA